ncbi:MAG: type IV pilin protein [Candidatus Endonucleobacter sp. (ex Gigantidas childressi)]|nr:type IV pilin protein [Candidatus Endonucleobacter sp. (ex Gigantidas childressi)]
MKVKGFTLVEIMIVVAIIGILASIGYPQYTKYVIESRRVGAMALLLEVMQEEERYFTKNLEYTATLSKLGYASDTLKSEGDYYAITAKECSPSPCIKVTATPQGDHVSNDGGKTFTLDTIGRRTGVWNN